MMGKETLRLVPSQQVHTMLSVNLVQHKETSQMKISPIHKASVSLIPDMSPAGIRAGAGTK